MLNLQPSELMKLASVLYAASYMVRKLDVMKHFGKGVLADGGRDGRDRRAAAAASPTWAPSSVIAAIAWASCSSAASTARMFPASPPR